MGQFKTDITGTRSSSWPHVHPPVIPEAMPFAFHLQQADDIQMAGCSSANKQQLLRSHSFYELSLQNNTLWLTCRTGKRQWIRTDEMSRVNPCFFFVTWAAHWLDFLFSEYSLVQSRDGCCWQVSIKRRDGLWEKLSVSETPSQYSFLPTDR